MTACFRKIQLWWPCLFLVASLAGAATVVTKPLPLPTDSELGFFNTTRDDLLQNIKRVGLMPARLPDGMEDREDVRAALQALAQKYFEKAGMEFIKSDSYLATYDRLNHQIGGIYDPKTGAIKPAERRAVIENSLQEFFEKERLDAVIMITVQADVARFAGGNAEWDGVVEYCDGKEPDQFLNASGCSNTGRLPSLSLLVQIVNKQKKVNFGQFGGIQLLGYFNSDAAKWGESNYFRVPSDKLLVDQRRLERAMRIATLPLVETPQKIALINHDLKQYDPERVNPKLLPRLPVAERPGSASGDATLSRDEILKSVHSVLLTPVSSWDLQLPEESRTRFVAGIRAEVEKLGWEIIVADPAVVEAWYKSPAASQPFFDPFSGKRDIAAAHNYRLSLVKALSPGKVPDAILWSSVRRVAISHVSGDAKWDGAGQSALTLGPIVDAFFKGTANPQAGEGVVPASTLVITLNAPDDSEMYKGRGGIELLGQAKINSQYSYGATHFTTTVAERAPAEVFKDTARMDAAVHFALRKLTLTPEQLELELYPKKK